jgi:hypothetical protein
LPLKLDSCGCTSYKVPAGLDEEGLGFRV